MNKRSSKINAWFKTAAGKISIGLFIASILLILIGIILSLLEGRSTPYSVAISLVFGIATNIASIIVTVTFVQSQFDKQDKKKAKEEEIKKIKRFNRVLKSYLNNYSQYFYCVTVPIKDRTGIYYSTLNTDFEFKDLMDLHYCTSLECDGFKKTSIQLFFEAENEVVLYFKRMIEEIDFDYHNELLSIISSFLDISIEFKDRNSILSYENQTITGENNLRKKLTDYIRENIENDDEFDWVNTLKDREHSNLLGSYVNLYELLKLEGNLINQYNDLVSIVLNNPSIGEQNEVSDT